jgi:hypothetical protein
VPIVEEEEEEEEGFVSHIILSSLLDSATKLHQ